MRPIAFSLECFHVSRRGHYPGRVPCPLVIPLQYVVFSWNQPSCEKHALPFCVYPMYVQHNNVFDINIFVFFNKSPSFLSLLPGDVPAAGPAGSPEARGKVVSQCSQSFPLQVNNTNDTLECWWISGVQKF